MVALLKHLQSPLPWASFPTVRPAPTLERQLRAAAGILQEGQQEGPEHLGALVVGGENVEQPPAPLATVPAGKSRS